VAILRRALEAPMRGIVENAGLDGAVVIAEIRRRQAETGDMAIGYDVMTNEYVDMFATGIIDPAKVTRSAVENASSIAAMILSTEALITDIPSKEPPAPAAGPEY
jgi:chaperonin GroEL